MPAAVRSASKKVGGTPRQSARLGSGDPAVLPPPFVLRLPHGQVARVEELDQGIDPLLVREACGMHEPRRRSPEILDKRDPGRSPTTQRVVVRMMRRHARSGRIDLTSAHRTGQRAHDLTIPRTRPKRSTPRCRLPKTSRSTTTRVVRMGVDTSGTTARSVCPRRWPRRPQDQHTREATASLGTDTSGPRRPAIGPRGALRTRESLNESTAVLVVRLRLESN